MRRAIMLGFDGVLTSDLVPPSTPSDVTVGMRFITLREVDLRPYCVVPRGARCAVVVAEDSMGALELELDIRHPGLGQWGNCITLVAFDTDDITGAFRLLDATESCGVHKRNLPSKILSTVGTLCS